MGTPGLVALILVALAVLLAAAVLVARGRRRAAVPAGPRTVAELVQLRAARAGQSAAPAPAESTADGPVEVVDEQTPWGRAALMAVAGAAQKAAPVPRPVPPPSHGRTSAPADPPVWREPGAAPADSWSGWADWNAVDAE